MRLDGQDLFALDEDARAAVRGRKVGFVFQSFQLLATLTALENVMLPLELQAAPTRAPRAEMLGRVGLAERLRPLSEAAFGRRAAARGAGARLRRAAGLLLADEPTGSLDFATGETVMELMFELNREAGTTLVLVTHDAGSPRAATRTMRRVDRQEDGMKSRMRMLSVTGPPGNCASCRGAGHRGGERDHGGLLRRSRGQALARDAHELLVATSC